MRTGVQCLQRSERGVGSLEVPSGSEPCDVGAGN